MDNDELRALALKRLKAKQQFTNYLWIWLGVAIITTGIYLVSNPGGYFWPAWVIGGMGIAAFFQGLAVFGPGRNVISEDQIDAEVHRIRGTTPPPTP